jgi:transposase
MDRDTFEVALTHLIKHDPGNVIIPIIHNLGYSAVSVSYLQSALDGLPVPTEKKLEKKDPALDELNQKLSKLFVKRSIESNKFHDVFTDHARILISKEIENIQSDIRNTMLTIDYFIKNGEMPATKDEFYIPKNPFDLKKKEEYLRQSISRAKRNLKKLLEDGKSTIRQEKTLDKLITYEAAVKRKIAEESIYR